MSDNRLPAILLLDDDPSVASALKRQLRHMSPFVLPVTPENVLLALDKHETGVVIVEPHFPDNARLLGEIRVHYPLVRRILLTGYPHLDSVIRVINESHPFQVLMKPWNDDELLDTVRAALHEYGLLKQQSTQCSESKEVRAITEERLARRMLDTFSNVASVPMPDSTSNEKNLDSWPVGALVFLGDELRSVNAAALRLFEHFSLPRVSPGSALQNLFPELRALFAAASVAIRGERHAFLLSEGCPVFYVAHDIVTEGQAPALLVVMAPGDVPRTEWSL